MKPYLAKNRIPVSGTILLLVGSVILGIAMGIISYFVSNLFYYLFVFSLAIGVITMLAYYKLLQFTKVRHTFFSTFVGLMTGLLVTLAFYAMQYWIVRNNFITDAQQYYQVSTKNASIAFDTTLVEKTGAGGLVGYMKFRAKEGDDFTNYLILNGIPIHESSFTLKSTWQWLYWLVETLLFSIPAAWIGYDVSKRAFSESANDWYNSLPEQICTLPLESKEKMLAMVKVDSLQEISELVIPEDGIVHPVIEIYGQKSMNKKGDILLSIKQTNRVNAKKIKRDIIGQWEISELKYKTFINEVNRRLAK